MLPPLFKSPFNGDFDYSKSAMPQCLGIKKIEDQPIVSARIITHTGEEIIESQRGKYYGLAFFYYCLQKYGTPAEKQFGLFNITFQMAIEAQLYYGEKLWSDYEEPHPSITPFRLASQGVQSIMVQLKYEPHH